MLRNSERKKESFFLLLAITQRALSVLKHQFGRDQLKSVSSCYRWLLLLVVCE